MHKEPGGEEVFKFVLCRKRQPASGAAFPNPGAFRLRRAGAPGEVTKGTIDGKEEFEQARCAEFVRFEGCFSAIRCGLHDATQETSRLSAQAPDGYYAAAELAVVTHSDYK